MNIFRCALCAIVAIAVVCSCDEWTMPESKKLEFPMVQEHNPRLWEAYLRSLRNYRQSDHKIVLAGFDNKTGVPCGRGEMLSALPDSVDFAVLSEPDGLSEDIQKDMVSLREEKSIGTLYTVNYENILASYEAYSKKWDDGHQTTEAGDDSTEGTSSDDGQKASRSDFFAGALADSLAIHDKYGYDGIIISFIGASTIKLTDEEKAAEKALQDEFFTPVKEWLSTHQDAVVMFSGRPQNLLSEDFLDLCRYIIIPAETAGSADKMSFLARSAMGDGIPSDRFIICVSAPYGKLGMSSTGLSAIEEAAGWVLNEDATYSRKGIMVIHSQKDYHSSMTYGNIRRAISIMNPSPKF